MPKNEIGCPAMAEIPRSVPMMPDIQPEENTDRQRPREGCSGNKPSSNGTTNHSCGGRGDCLDTMPLAYVYAPNQKFCMLYSASDALSHGTLFEQLYKPTEVYGNE